MFMAPSTEREKRRSTPSWLAAVLIFELNMGRRERLESSTPMIVETQVGPFFQNGFVASCETTKEAVLIDPRRSRLAAGVRRTAG